MKYIVFTISNNSLLLNYGYGYYSTISIDLSILNIISLPGRISYCRCPIFLNILFNKPWKTKKNHIRAIKNISQFRKHYGKYYNNPTHLFRTIFDYNNFYFYCKIIRRKMYQSTPLKFEKHSAKTLNVFRKNTFHGYRSTVYIFFFFAH